MYSNRATSGSSDAGSDELDSVYTPSRSSQPERRRPMTRRHLQDLQAAQESHEDTAYATDEMSSLNSNPFRGLTPAPLPPAMLPSKKRSLDEVLRDNSPPQKDKLFTEIEQLSGEEVSRPHTPPAGPSGTQNNMPVWSHQRKKSRVSIESSGPRVVPIARGDPVTNSDRRRGTSLERNSENNHDGFGHGDRGDLE
ncbi:hypothetical protein SAMD00023353_1800320 [Rosellinia necatrix]|uniref:Uncharacterized protein n=1 Tax=Rosellinia necatrix TaxID=77044 RepID=A0A1W2TED9_ROSNE|nr:hypothetical protein SAMD00023353_1800320 [Rosellinia necatrix]